MRDLWDEDSLMGLFILHPFVFSPIKRNFTEKSGRLFLVQTIKRI